MTKDLLGIRGIDDDTADRLHIKGIDDCMPRGTIASMSETEFLKQENERLKLELEKIKYKIMKDDVEKELDLYYYFIQHYNKDTYLSLVTDGKFLELFSEEFNVGRCQMLIDKYSYDDVVTVVKNFCKELPQEKEKEGEKE